MKTPKTKADTILESAMRKIAKANLSPAEIEETANYFANCVAMRVCEFEGLKDADFHKAYRQIRNSMQRGIPS